MTTIARQPQVDEFQMLIDGQSTGARSGRTYESVDPFTGRTWARVPDAGDADVQAAVAAARAALEGPWGAMTPTQRGKLLHRLGELIAREAGRLAELETRDNGKLLREMAGQMAYLPEWYFYYAGLADKV
ncbi:MAG: aldehyde dehydrogenase family protein, partial [Actinomycetes bacterium]